MREMAGPLLKEEGAGAPLELCFLPCLKDKLTAVCGKHPIGSCIVVCHKINITTDINTMPQILAFDKGISGGLIIIVQPRGVGVAEIRSPMTGESVRGELYVGHDQ